MSILEAKGKVVSTLFGVMMILASLDYVAGATPITWRYIAPAFLARSANGTPAVAEGVEPALSHHGSPFGDALSNRNAAGTATSVPMTANAALVPAFPEAEGWGATALNECRSKPIQVLSVTNTNSEGAGSLTQAVQNVRSDHFTFIIFRTGGRILAPRIRLEAGCVYIAGQTAPGDGVAIEGRSTALSFRGYGRNTTDVVIRYVRFRGTHGKTRNNLIIARGERIVLDHISFSWTDNYLLALIRYGDSAWSGPISDVSVQNSILSEVFAEHPTAFVVGSNNALKTAPSIGMKNVSIQRNLMAHNSHRNPMVAADNALVVNNVVYNWRQGAGMMNRRGKVDWVNNYAKPGPMTRSASRHIVNPYCNDEFDGNFSIYAVGNTGPTTDVATGDNWSGASRQVACYYDSGTSPGAEVPQRWRRDSPQPWASTAFPIRPLPAAAAYDAVLKDVGANARLSCDGRWVSTVDAVDARVISETMNGTGVSRPPRDEHAVGGWPTYGEGTPCADADNDGLPDEWEERFFGCAACTDPAGVGEDGYLVMEHYLNGTSPR